MGAGIGCANLTNVMGYRKALLLMPVAFLALHLNYWMWNETAIVWGFPVNLLYHVFLSLLLSLVMLAVVFRAWPGYLDED